jgi:hypothetical protein
MLSGSIVMTAASFGRILRWLGSSLAILGAGYVLIMVGLFWFGDYMSEGVLETETLQGNVLVALSNGPAVRQELLSNCRPRQELFLASTALTEIPSGTKMQMPDWGQDDEVTAVQIYEGRLKGRSVWACRGQVKLLHAMP